MQLSDHTDFGLRILMTLALSKEERWSARRLAEHLDLSFTHVQKVVQSLESADLVQTFRGRGGGVSLAQRPTEVTIGRVVRALEPHMDLVRCFRPDESGCVMDRGCGLKKVLYDARAAFVAELDRHTLADVSLTPARPGDLIVLRS